ncbi:hypothetical protein FOCC_FOCC008676 [Frankliniella occidentalis]|nr:hypothetical protein FOCC_FOCC008676 [Frankliniella occidentalis]
MKQNHLEQNQSSSSKSGQDSSDSCFIIPIITTMALSTTNVDFSIPIPAPGSKYHLDSPDSKWTWSLKIPKISECTVSASFDAEWDGHTVNVDVELPVLKEMLRYIYTGSLGDNVDMVKLLVAADMYLVSDLCDEVSERLKHNLSSNINNASSTCCNLLKKSAANNSPSLWRVVLHYLKSHRDQVLKSKEWGEFQRTNHQTAAEAVLDMYNLPD